MTTQFVKRDGVASVALDSTAPTVAVDWTDPLTGARGYLVIDRLIRGVSSGGLRMRKGCTFDEVHQLAKAMSAKEALHYNPLHKYIPMGGAKGGIDFDPSSTQAPEVLHRFFEHIRPFLEENWATGDDLGTSGELIDMTLDAVGIDGCIAPVMYLLDDPVDARTRFTKAFSLDVDGIGLAELVGGCGVAEATLTALDRSGRPHHEATAVIQGFGSMGGATARFLNEAGLRITAVADAVGTVVNLQGLAIEEMLADRLPGGLIDRTKLRSVDVILARDSWLDIEADVLIPAANSYCITATNQERITSKIIVEAANLPVSAEADAALRARGIMTLPDVVVNSGTNAWWWWVLFGDVNADAADSFDMVRRSLRLLTEEMIDLAQEHEIGPRAAAHLMATARYEMLMRRLGAEADHHAFL
jgi:glutamate dehydrogenase (NAD(P)+)